MASLARQQDGVGVPYLFREQQRTLMYHCSTDYAPVRCGNVTHTWYVSHLVGECNKADAVQSLGC